MEARRRGDDLRFLERGDLYFAYRPRVQEPEPSDVTDIQRLYVLLQPEEGGPHRRLVVGRKQLPEEHEHERFWGFVDEVVESPEEIAEQLGRETYRTKTRGERVLPEARPAGEGRYGIVLHGDHTHLAYALELPRHPGEVQEELNIEGEGSYVIAMKNPEVPSPPGVGLAAGRQADLPKRLLERFGGRRFTACLPELLDVEGMEFILVGAAEDPGEELGVELGEDEGETLETAEIFHRLRLPRGRHPEEPLARGEWR